MPRSVSKFTVNYLHLFKCDCLKKPVEAKCQEQGGRLLRVTSLYDINMLTAAAGGDVNSDPYDGHAVAAEDIVEEGTWKSYETLLDDALWSDGKPDGLDAMNCAFIVVETGMEDTTERYRNGYSFTYDEMIDKRLWL